MRGAGPCPGVASWAGRPAGPPTARALPGTRTGRGTCPHPRTTQIGCRRPPQPATQVGSRSQWNPTQGRARADPKLSLCQPRTEFVPVWGRLCANMLARMCRYGAEPALLCPNLQLSSANTGRACTNQEPTWRKAHTDTGSRLCQGKEDVGASRRERQSRTPPLRTINFMPTGTRSLAKEGNPPSISLTY